MTTLSHCTFRQAIQILTCSIYLEIQICHVITRSILTFLYLYILPFYYLSKTLNLFPHSSKCSTSSPTDWSQQWGCGRRGDWGNFGGGRLAVCSFHCCPGYVAEKTSKNWRLCYIWVSWGMDGGQLCHSVHFWNFSTKANLLTCQTIDYTYRK